MRLDVFGQIGVAVATAYQSKDARPQNAEGAHDSVSNSRCRIETVRAQLSVSWASCLWPLRVML